MQRKSKSPSTRKLRSINNPSTNVNLTEQQIREEMSLILFFKAMKTFLGSLNDDALERTEARLQQAMIDVQYADARAKARAGQ